MSIQSNAILLVEDDASAVYLMKRALRHHGVEVPVLVAEDGQIALDYLLGHGPYSNRAEHPLPRVVLLDISMPRQSGFDVLRTVREHSTLRFLPVVMFSSSSDPRDLGRAYDLGANAYLVKPMDFDQLLQQTRSLKEFWLGLNEIHWPGPETGDLTP